MRTCPTGKQVLTKRMAKKVHLATGERADINVYWCSKCRGFHLGHSRSPHRQQKRLDQIFERLKRDGK